MLALLDDPAYKRNSADPTSYLEKKTRAIILGSALDDETKKHLVPREKSSRCPKIYGLPKIHKVGIPLRPIVSSVGSPTQALAKHLAKFIQPYMEDAKSYVRNSEHFIEILKCHEIQQSHLLVSFDVVSLFTNVPIAETLHILRNKISLPDDIVVLMDHCLNNTYFRFEGQMYKQTKGAPMGSPLSPVVANIFMEDLEVRALDTATVKPYLWLRYVDDTFVIWTHGRLELDKFLKHLNSLHENIKFTMEVEENLKLPFLDVLVSKKANNKFGYSVYRKPTHTNRYLNAKSHHHPAQIRAVAKTLATRSMRLTDQDHAQQEVAYLRAALKSNGYSEDTISNAIHPKQKTRTTNLETKSPRSFAFLPYVHGSTDRISRLLMKHDVKTIFKTDRTISSLLRSAKDTVPLESHGIYEIPCGSCEQTYIGRTNRKISTRINEHRISIKRKDTSSSLFPTCAE